MPSSPAIESVKRDETLSKSMTAFAVGFFFAFRLVIPVFSVKILGTDPQTGSEIRLALSLVLFWLVCIDGLGTTSHSLGSLLRASPVRWVLVFLLFSGCSLLWGEAASPLASFAYWCGTACDVVIVISLFRTGTPDGVAGSLLRGFVCGACCIALIAWVMPGQSDLRLGDEEFFNSNSIGNTCALGVFFSQYLMRRDKGKWGLAVLFLVLTLVRSLSKTTIAAFAVSEVFLVIQDRSMSRKTKTALTVAAVIVILVFWALFEAYYNLYTSTGNQAETLTGRTAIWAYVFDHALEAPWFGHGFDAMWGVIPLFGTFEARHAENELLEQFYSYGLVGVLLIIGVYGGLYRAIRRVTYGDVKIILTSILLFIIIRGLAEAEPFDLLLPVWSVVVIGMLTPYDSKVVRADVSTAMAATQLQLAP
jgi:exopolysaccharide production protein ExoQ